jgi:hypothetical protein
METCSNEPATYCDADDETVVGVESSKQGSLRRGRDLRGVVTLRSFLFHRHPQTLERRSK